MDYSRLKDLDEKVRNKTASEQEKLEYLEMLQKNESITKKQLDNYRNGKLKDDLITAGLAIGGMLLLAWLINKLIKD
ncbi:MAG: hypothetical protein LBU90_03840 [Bacteroidales bacterium]|jgi:hypothetical protein|nr:hypothetical protein [Bacteroidales bacterium]